jgi:hypothetical protein
MEIIGKNTDIHSLAKPLPVNTVIIGLSYLKESDTMPLSREQNFIKNLRLRLYESKLKKETEDNMETLYNVLVVGKRREILVDKKVVAKNAKSAEFEVAHKYLIANDLSIENVTIIVKEIGSVEVEE